MKRRKKAVASRGALGIIALILVLSGAARLWGETGHALAREITSLARPAKPSTPETCEPTPEIGAVLAALQEREAKLIAAEARAAEKEQTLAVAKDEVTRQIALLEETEANLRATITLAEEAAENDVSRLTSVYENMKPADAAPLFEQMAPDFAAGFLARMRPESAAAVMAGMSPERAYTISVVLAGRNAGIPQE